VSELAVHWRDALAALEVRHPNGRSQVVLRVIDGGPPQLYVGLDETTCTLTGETKRDFAISTVKLTYWPGVTLAQQWFAAAWVGYLQHEALELVTIAGDRGRKVLDPHAEPYSTNPLNRGLRVGFPVELEPTSLAETLEMALGDEVMIELVNVDRGMWLGSDPRSLSPRWMR
jgi:hypothetical protein